MQAPWVEGLLVQELRDLESFFLGVRGRLQVVHCVLEGNGHTLNQTCKSVSFMVQHVFSAVYSPA